MRPVNLLPSRYRPRRATGARTGVAYAAIGVLAVLLLMVLGIVITNNQINDAKDKTAKANAEAAAANAQIGQLQAYGNFAALKNSREAAVKGIAEVRFDWERLMREMALVLPHNTYLTSFSAAPGGAAATSGATGTGPSVTLAGCAPSYPTVATAIVRMRKIHNVVDVDLTNSAKAPAGSGNQNACTISFSALVTMQAEAAPTTPQPVPARLGGGQ